MRKAYGPWTGVDLRRVLDGADPRTIRNAVNVDLLTDGSFRERDGMQLVNTLDANSVGLYSVGGVLRSVLPAGYSKPATSTGAIPVTYDFVGDGTIYGLATISRVSSVSSWSADSALGIYPYIVIQRTTGKYEHHWITDIPVPNVNGAPPPAYVPSADPVSTKITLPFSPGEIVLKIQEKVCAVDNINGSVPFCSTLNGARDWTLVADAGYLPVIRHATGDRTIYGLSFYDSLMCVAFSDSIQLWKMDPDPARHQLVRVMGGPGVQYPGSMANIRGDLIYFSRGVFSTLKTALSGQLQDGDVGAPIAPATKLLTATRPFAVWSQARAQYFCAFGMDVWVYTWSPSSKVTGWTKYELGRTVDALVEHLGELYIRSGVSVYRFTAGYNDGTTYTLDTQFLDQGVPGEWKFYRAADFTCYGTPTVYTIPDMRNTAFAEKLCTLDGSTASLVDVAVLDNSEAMSFRFTGTVGAGGSANRFKLDRFIVDVDASMKRK